MKTALKTALKPRTLTTAFAVTTLALITACSSAPMRDDRSIYNANTPVRPVPTYTEYGRGENIGVVQTAARSGAAGAILGAVIGGVIGNQIGSGTGKALATGAGVVGGALAGNAIENRNRRDDEIYRVTVRFDNGGVRDLDFQRVDDLRIGDRVKFEGGQLHRM